MRCPELIIWYSQRFNYVTCDNLGLENLHNKHVYAWRQLVSKASFESGVSVTSIEIFQPINQQCDSYEHATWNASMPFMCRNISSASARAFEEVRISDQGLNIIWVVISVGAGAFSLLEILYWTWKDSDNFYHMVHLGYPFSLHIRPEPSVGAAESRDPHTIKYKYFWCKDGWAVAHWWIVVSVRSSSI